MRPNTSTTAVTHPPSVQLLDAAMAQEKETLHLSGFDEALPSLIARWLMLRPANPQQQALMFFARVQAHLGRPEQFSRTVTIERPHL